MSAISLSKQELMNLKPGYGSGSNILKAYIDQLLKANEGKNENTSRTAIVFLYESNS